MVYNHCCLVCIFVFLLFFLRGLCLIIRLFVLLLDQNDRHQDTNAHHQQRQQKNDPPGDATSIAIAAGGITGTGIAGLGGFGGHKASDLIDGRILCFFTVVADTIAVFVLEFVVAGRNSQVFLAYRNFIGGKVLTAIGTMVVGQHSVGGTILSVRGRNLLNQIAIAMGRRNGDRTHNGDFLIACGILENLTTIADIMLFVTAFCTSGILCRYFLRVVLVIQGNLDNITANCASLVGSLRCGRAGHMGLDSFHSTASASGCMTVLALIGIGLIFVFRSGNNQGFLCGFPLLGSKIGFAITANIVSLHTIFQLINGMYRICLRNQHAQAMIHSQNYGIFICNLILCGRILKPLTTIGTFVVQNITLLTAGGLYGFNTIQGMIMSLVFRFFTIAAIGTSFKAYHTRLYANIALFTLRTPTTGTIFTNVLAIGTKLSAITASAAIRADQLGAITADRSAIRTHIYAIIAGVTLFAPGFCAISADLFTIGAKLYTVAAGFALFAPNLKAIHAAVAFLAPCIGAIFADFFAVLAKIHAVGAKLAAFTPGIGASVADRSAIFTDFSAIAAGAAILAPEVCAVNADLFAVAAKLSAFRADFLAILADRAAIGAAFAFFTAVIRAADAFSAIGAEKFVQALWTGVATRTPVCFICDCTLVAQSAFITDEIVFRAILAEGRAIIVCASYIVATEAGPTY